MVLVMSRPFRRPDTSFIHFRKRVPADIQRSGMGKMLVFMFPGDAVGDPDIVIKLPLGSEVKLSLRIRDPAIAKLRTDLVSAQLERMFNAWRQEPQRLTHRQRVALAGMVYREFVEWLADDPGEASIWQTVRDAHLNAQIEHQRMERWFGPTVDDLLLREGVITDGESRLASMAEVARVMIGAADRLERHATGDYRAGDVAKASRLGKACHRARTQLKAALTFDDLFGRWMREANPAPSTITTLRSYMKQLREHVGHDDPARVAKNGNSSFRCRHQI